MKQEYRWFREAKLGLFIHFGLYSHLAGEWNGIKAESCSEWIMNTLDIPAEEYRKTAQVFNPENFDADALVKRAKQKWGMKYIVFTSKHHDGFAMYRSKVSKYNIVDATPCGRDIMKELQIACEKYGMMFCIYYSQAQDWDDPDGYWANHDNSGKNFDRYFRNKCLPQIREILTEYGKVGLVWYDTPVGLTLEQSQEIVDLTKSLQPDCLVCGRVGNGLGDYVSIPDNFIPTHPYDGLWEVPCTLNETWGYSKFDKDWKSSDELRRIMLEINSLGGNYLINIGPDGNGDVPEKSMQMLDELGEYVMRNEEGITGTEAVMDLNYRIPCGYAVRKPHRLYVHVTEKTHGFTVLGLKSKIRRIYVLETGEDIRWGVIDAQLYGDWDPIRIPESYWDRADYCICIETEDEEHDFISLV